ncbi:MAG: thiamine phosphate synthase [Kiritimatiellaeota bacterium]|nr:thiamine phosphate synthase [Kiritimatiellota bacterium]
MSEILSERISRFSRVDVYPVVSSEFCAGRSPVDVLKGIADGGAKVVQLREKNMPKPETAKLADEFKRVTDEYGMLLIINDHVDVALACGADGTHLGQDDVPQLEAREIAPDLIIGVSTHSKAEVVDAMKEGASYINIGPIFQTGTKSLPMKPLGLDLLREIAPSVEIPFSVMGGIKARHIPELTAAGASIIAMVTEITRADDIAAKVRELRGLIKNSLAS